MNGSSDRPTRIKASTRRAFRKGATRREFYGRCQRLIEQRFAPITMIELLWQAASDDGKRPNTPVAQLCVHIRRELEAGRSFPQALRGWVPAEHLLLLASAQGPELARALAQCRELDQLSADMRSTIWGAVRYPMFLFCLIYALCYFYSLQIIPSYDALLPVETWTGVPATLPSLFHFVTGGPLYYVIGALLFLWFLIRRSLPRWTGPVRDVCDHFPPWSVYRAYHSAHFMVGLAALLRLRSSPENALLQLSQHASPWLAHRIGRVRAQVLSGFGIGEAFFRADPSFPDADLTRELRALSAVEGFEEELEVFALRWANETVDRMRTSAAIFEKVGPMLNAVLVGWILIGLATLGTQLESGIGGGF